MTVSLELLRTRAAEIRQALAALRAAAQISAEAFAANEDLRDASLYRVLTAIEAAQSICLHLAARLPTRAPDSMPDCFGSLAERGVITPELGERLSQMSRFGNLLVHRYWELDLARVHRSLGEDLGDLDLYLEQVGEHLRDSL